MTRLVVSVAAITILILVTDRPLVLLAGIAAGAILRLALALPRPTRQPPDNLIPFDEWRNRTR